MWRLPPARHVTGHELDTIDEVLKRYAALIADHAATALDVRLAHDAADADDRAGVLSHMLS